MKRNVGVSMGCPMLDRIIGERTPRELWAARWVEENWANLENFQNNPEKFGGEAMEIVAGCLQDEVALFLMKCATEVKQ